MTALNGAINRLQSVGADPAEIEAVMTAFDAFDLDGRIAFEWAETLIQERIASEVQNFKSKGGDDPYISLTQIGWSIYPNKVGKDYSHGKTLKLALEKAPKLLSKEESKAARIAELQGELAKLMDLKA